MLYIKATNLSPLHNTKIRHILPKNLTGLVKIKKWLWKDSGTSTCSQAQFLTHTIILCSYWMMLNRKCKLQAVYSKNIWSFFFIMVTLSFYTLNDCKLINVFTLLYSKGYYFIFFIYYYKRCRVFKMLVKTPHEDSILWASPSFQAFSEVSLVFKKERPSKGG